MRWNVQRPNVDARTQKTERGKTGCKQVPNVEEHRSKRFNVEDPIQI